MEFVNLYTPSPRPNGRNEETGGLKHTPSIEMRCRWLVSLASDPLASTKPRDWWMCGIWMPGALNSVTTAMVHLLAPRL